MRFAFSTLSLLFIISSFITVQAGSEHHSKYVGQEKRVIKSLSSDDIDELKNGRGWGLAKAAELNGMPGPSHLLQMKSEINMTPEQEQKIKALFDKMKNQAIKLGTKLITLEAKLNQSFSTKNIDEAILREMLDEITNVRKELRYVHLSTHLATPTILTVSQIAIYNTLRGYGVSDPCATIPKGHDASRWKKHNNCA